MCGIAGSVQFNGAPPDLPGLEKALHALEQRGPDGECRSIGPWWAVGARRLHVVGSSDRWQPFAGNQGSIGLFNGEIYNYLSLRRELERDGATFQTDNDGEVIVHLYERDGVVGFSRLQGMFAAAILDGRDHSLVLARDRAGKKPLFYHYVAHDRITFGSSLSALRSFEGTPATIDPEAVDCFLSFRIIPAPMTIYNELRKVSPGRAMIFREGAAAEQPFATFPPPRAVREDDEPDLVRELGDQLLRAVDDRLQARVPDGVFLSGGLDSSLVLSLVARHRDRPLKTFTVGFHEAPFDERGRARAVAGRFGSEHHEATLRSSELVELAPRILEATGEPFAFPSILASWAMSRLAQDRAVVVLGGDGADELFGGYQRYRRFGAELASAPLGRADPAEIYGRILADGVPDHIKRGLYRQSFAETLSRSYPTAFVRERLESTPGPDPISRALQMDFGFWLPDGQMVKVDVASMAHSVEARSPLLDDRIIDLAWSLPLSRKLAPGRDKAILRQVSQSMLPTAVSDRSKQELAVPLESWLTNELRAEITRELTSEASLDRGYFEPDAVRKLVTNFEPRHSYAIWTLYVLEKWHATVHKAN